MPIKYADVDGGIGTVFEARGLLTSDEWASCFREYLSQGNKKLEQYKFNLCDYSAVTETTVSSSDIRSSALISRDSAASMQDLVYCIIAPQDLIHGLARVGIAVGDLPWEINLVKTRKEAEEWIRAEVKEKFGIEQIQFS